MKMRKFIVSTAAAAMVLGSTVAQAAPVARTGSSVAGEDLQGENSVHWWLGALGLGILVLVLLGVNNNDEEDNLPTSP
ncbi:MAG TPA: hypothetical protein VI168_15700 [Croceibacterium sp.]